MWRMDTVKERESTAKKKKGGRPQKVIKKSTMLMVRLSPLERIIITNKAQEAGMNPSEWFRLAARRAKVVPRLSKEEAGWLRSLSGLSNNLNQLTRLAHTTGMVNLASDCRRLMEQVALFIEKLMRDDR